MSGDEINKVYDMGLALREEQTSSISNDCLPSITLAGMCLLPLDQASELHGQ
jgi:hypothetical protein